MSIASATLTLYVPDPKDPKAENDPQVKKIEAQIKDWETCPTTDPQTKRKVVEPLIQQVDSLKAGIDRASKAPIATVQQSAAASSKTFPGSFDVKV